MKSTFKTAMLLAGAASFATPAMAAVTLENGSLAVAFYQVLAGNVIGNNTLVVDLGQANLFRENTNPNNVSVSTINPGIANANINTALVNAFGSGWANDGTVRWVAVGNVAQGTGPISGDPGRTSYFSVARNDFNAPSTGFQVVSSGVRIPASNNVTQFFSGVQNDPSTLTNADAAQIAKGDLFTIDEYVNPTTPGLYFSIGQNMTQTFGTGTIAGGVSTEGALDLFRMLHTFTGADLTTGLGGPASLISGDPAQFVGTLTLDSLGNLGVGNFSPVPEPSGALALGVIGTLAGLGYRNRRQKANA